MRVYDSKNFYYEVQVQHLPQFGTSTASYRGERIARREYGRGPLPPWGESDAEHEAYQESLAEWCDAAESDLALICHEYFNSQP
jgi:hypothetical protein